MDCVCCGCSLKGGVLTLPWEDGALTAGKRTYKKDMARMMTERRVQLCS